MKDSSDPGGKLWSGRFSGRTDRFVEQFTASVSFDKRLYPYDIAGSIAHTRMLAKVKVLTQSEKDQIIAGLEEIKSDIEHDNFAWLDELEDVHMNIEARLTERIGEVGKKLHTGRSRNDQIATDMRLFTLDALRIVDQQIEKFAEVLLDLAEREAETIMPGFTHLQTAQPVTFGHHVLAWLEMLKRDRQRFQQCRKHTSIMPLGSAALAGTTFPIDRHYTAELLGFDAVSENSLDAVSDRDFAIEFNAAAALLMTHLSRISEELVLWSSAQFEFISLSDAYCTGSSIMPQKKNPDIPELVRGKTGRVTGNLMALLTLMKGQPLAYNRDNQEDKEPLFDTFDTIRNCLQAYTGMMRELMVNKDKMYAAAARGYSTATDLADYLVRKGIPFRDAHEIVGKLVQLAIKTERQLEQISLEEMQQLCPSIEIDLYEVLTLEGSVSARNHIGGTAPNQVREAIGRYRSLT